MTKMSVIACCDQEDMSYRILQVAHQYNDLNTILNELSIVSQCHSLKVNKYSVEIDETHPLSCVSE